MLASSLTSCLIVSVRCNCEDDDNLDDDDGGADDRHDDADDDMTKADILSPAGGAAHPPSFFP